jgi:hypothetical protein
MKIRALTDAADPTPPYGRRDGGGQCQRTHAIGSGDGGSHVDVSYAFFVHKTVPAGLCAMTRAAYTGWPGWRDVAVWCGEGRTGYSTWVMDLDVTAVSMRVCLAFEGGVRGCTQAVPLYDDGRT